MALVVGLLAGQCADRMIVRLALGRSFFWPFRDRCQHCHAGLPLGWSIPLLGFFLAGMRCGACGRILRLRSLFLQCLTAGLVVGLYCLYFQERGFIFPRLPLPLTERHLWAIWIYHSILMTLLVAATFIDIDWMIIPDSVTVTGMILAVLLGTFWYVELHPVLLLEPGYRAQVGLIPEDAFARWVDPLPAWADQVRLAVNDHWLHHWNRWIGFLTSVVGLLVGGATVWIVRAVCSWIFRVEAIGFGDVTLMAMVGAFVGWQTSIIAFFLAPISAVLVGIVAWLITGNRAIPYGPHLSIASAACVFFWRPIWAYSADLFDHMGIFLFMAGAMLVVLVAVASIIQGVKVVWSGVARRHEPHAGTE
jgi:leader peptidase (prepilin peptidase)/N-methyltransferase